MTTSDLEVDKSVAVRVLTTLPAVRAALRRAEDLFDDTAVPFCGRSIWLSTWYERSSWRPVVICVEAAGRPAGLAALAMRRHGILRTVVLAGHGPSDYGRLPARDAAAAQALADAIVEWLAALRGPWRLELAQLAVDDPVVAILLRRLPRARLIEDQACPVLTFGTVREPRVVFPGKTHRELRRGRNRLTAAGVAPTIARSSTAAAVREVLPEILDLHRTRDHALGRRSDLDGAAPRSFYVEALAALAEAGQLDIWTLKIEGVLAAFFVGVRDGDSYRILDGRMAEHWRSASPALILRIELISALLADPAVVEVDYMRGVLHHKMQDANRVVPAERLLAESARWVARVIQVRQRLRQAARRRLPGGVRSLLVALLTARGGRSRSSHAIPDADPATPPPPDA